MNTTICKVRNSAMPCSPRHPDNPPSRSISDRCTIANTKIRATRNFVARQPKPVAEPGGAIARATLPASRIAAAGSTDI